MDLSSCYFAIPSPRWGPRVSCINNFGFSGFASHQSENETIVANEANQYLQNNPQV
jgi:hypothetical protein